MDRAAFIFWVLATIALIDVAIINLPLILARKGHKPRLGLFAGPLLGLIAAFFAIFALKPIFFLVLDGAQAALGVALNEEREIIDVNWDASGTRLIAWTENDTVSLYSLSQISSPSKFEHQEGELEHSAWGPDQEHLLTWGSGDTIELWTTTDTNSPKYLMRHDAPVANAIWNTDRDAPKVLSWSENGTVYIWNPNEDLDLPLILRTVDDNAQLNQASWNEDETKVLLWYTDGTVRIWDIEDIAAGARLSTTESIIERSPFLALRVPKRTIAHQGGLRNGDLLLRLGEQTFNLDEILLENELDPSEDPATIASTIRNSLNNRINAAFSAAIADGFISVEVYRQGETRTVILEIPPISDTNATQEFSDLGFTVNYVGQNPTVVNIGETSANTLPWSPNRDRILSWSIDNVIRVFDVDNPQEFIALPYQQEVQGAQWSDNNEEIIFWTDTEVFAWNLDDDYAATRSADLDAIERQQGFILSGSILENIGIESARLIKVGDREINVATLITEYAIDASTTRQINRALSPIVEEIIAQEAIQAAFNNQSLPLELYYNGEFTTFEVSVNLDDPTINPPLFPSLRLPFLTSESLGLSVEFISENPKSVPLNSAVIDVVASTDEAVAVILFEDHSALIWNLDRQDAPITLENTAHAVWSNEGNHLVTWSDQSQFINIRTLDDLNSPIRIEINNEISNVVWSLNDEFFAVIAGKEKVLIFQVEDLNTPLYTFEHDGNILGVEWSPNEQRQALLVYLDNGLIDAWSLADGSKREINLNSEVAFSDNLNFGVSFDNIIPQFNVSDARTRSLAFIQALMAGLLTFFGGYLTLKLIYRLIPSVNEEAISMQVSTLARQLRGRVLQIHYFIAIVIGMLALSALLWNITKEIFTIVAVSETVDPTTLTGGRELSELDKDEIALLIVENANAQFVRTAIRDYVWGVDERVASANGEGLKPIYESSLRDKLPEGIRIPENISYADLLEPENTDAIVELMAYNTDKAVLDRLAIITGLSHENLVKELLEELGTEGVIDLIIQQNIWPEINTNQQTPYDPTLLQTTFNLSELPPDNITFETLPEHPEILREILMASAPNGFTRGQLEDALYASNAEFNTSQLPTINQFGVDKAPPQSILNRLVAQVIVDNTLKNSSIERLREIFRIYTWGIDEETARNLAEQPILEVSELKGTPYIPADLDFVFLQYDSDAMRYLLRENLNKVDLEALAIDLVAQPFIVRTWTLDVLIQRELFGSDEVDEQLQALNAARAEEAAQNNTTWNDAELEYRSWINFNFVRRTLNADAELTGMRNAILGTLWVIAVTIIFAFPVGIGAAIYLEEYAGNNPIKRLIQTNIDNLAGVPSIIYGLLGVALFVRALEPITSGTALGLSNPITANGRTVLSAGLTMGLLILPIIIINAQEAIRAVQPSIRQASYGLGATKWQTIWNHVLPYAMPGILTGTILATSRAIGETAPLLVVGGITFITTDPTGPFSKFTALPLQIYFWTSQPRDADKAVAAATIVILLAILISLNSFAIILRNRFEKQVRGR